VPTASPSPACRRAPAVLLAALVVFALAGCAPAAGRAPTAPPDAAVAGSVRLYTSAQQPTVDAVLAALAETHPELVVETFRAPTGELAARIAAEEREGRVRADVLWLSDPLSIEGYAARGLLREWAPANASGLDPADAADSWWGTRILNVVIVRRAGDGATVDAGATAPGPVSWHDLADPAYRGRLAIPDPGFAGSAFGALGWFAAADGFGLDFYRALAANGAVQLKAPDEVTTGVAEGRFDIGMTLDFSVRAAAAKGSPVELAWPEEGAIALAAPIGVVETTDAAASAEAFVEFVLSDAGQAAIAGSGWQPIRPGLGGPLPAGPQVRPDWAAAFGRQAELLAAYEAIFGG
jgi:iron(III) transport system substrate-binding protein